jgi:hypothetical protein
LDALDAQTRGELRGLCAQAGDEVVACAQESAPLFPAQFAHVALKARGALIRGRHSVGLLILVFALVGRSQHCFVELLLGGEENALACALLVLVLLVRRELPHQLAARGALHDDERLVLETSTLKQLSWEPLGINDYGGENARHHLILDTGL